MKSLTILKAFVIFFGFCTPVFAEKEPEELLNAVVRIQAIVPEDARTAGILGTEREGHGVLIDSTGIILTTGYLILESESIEVTGPEGLGPRRFRGKSHIDHSKGDRDPRIHSDHERPL